MANSSDIIVSGCTAVFVRDGQTGFWQPLVRGPHHAPLMLESSIVEILTVVATSCEEVQCVVGVVVTIITMVLTGGDTNYPKIIVMLYYTDFIVWYYLRNH